MKWLEISVISLLVFVIKCRAMSHVELEDFSNFLIRTSQLDQNVKNAEPEDELDDEPISDHAWEESGKFEGDLILNEKQRHLIVENVAEGLSRNGLKDSTKRWPNNEVIYFIQREHFSGDQVQAIENGIDDIARVSCIKFRPYEKGDRDAVVIQGSRRGCFSQVGYQGGYQILNLAGRHPVGRGCFRHGTVVHELLHTLGFYHMQSSHDRDDYVDIVWKNIREKAKNNFRKYNSFSVSDFGIGYDYDSVLHYSRRAFSVNGRDTIIPKQAGAEIGQRVGLSEKDTQKLNKMYCEADSSHFDANEDINKKSSSSKKKKSKNTPFEGHGIGYHQGKAVAIQLPAAKTYKLPVVSSYQVFDFSKAPETVSPAVIQGLGIGKEVEHHEIPSTSTLLNDETYKKSVVPVTDLRNLEVIDDINLSKLNEHKDTESLNGAIKYTKNNNSTQFKKPYTRSYLDDDFDRLSKVIKNKVYPSQTTDYKEYKVFNDYGKYYNPNEETEYQSSLKDVETPDKHEDINNKESETFYGLVQKDQAKDIINEDYDPSRKWSINKYPFYTLKSSEVINDKHINDKNFFSPTYDSIENNQYKDHFSRSYKPKIYNTNTKTHSLFGAATPLQDNWYQREFKDKHLNRELGGNEHKQQDIDPKTNKRGLESHTIKSNDFQENNFKVDKDLHDDFLKKIKKNYLHTQSVDLKRKNIGPSTKKTIPYISVRSKSKQVAFDDYLLGKMNLQNRIASILKGYHKYDNFDAPSFNSEEILTVSEPLVLDLETDYRGYGNRRGAAGYPIDFM